jgi:hypothetical protein
MSTFNMYETLGTITYQYAYGETANPSNWNGSWLTKAQVKAASNVTGRYFKIKATLAGGDYDATLSDGSIQLVANSITTPAVGKVELNIQYGLDGTEKTGTLSTGVSYPITLPLSVSTNANDNTVTPVTL